MTNTYQHKSEDQEHLRHIDPEPQSKYGGSDLHHDQSQGALHLHGSIENGMQGQSPFTSDGPQGQGNPFTPDIQGQGGYAQPHGQDFGYTHTDTQGQGMGSTDIQGQGPSGTGVEQYNAYGSNFPSDYDPFQATNQALNGLDGVQQSFQPLGDVQCQNPFSDSPGGFLQDQMSQIPTGVLPSVHAGITINAPAIGSSLSGLLSPVAAAARRRVFGKKDLTPTSKGVPGMCFFLLLNLFVLKKLKSSVYCASSFAPFLNEN